MKVLIVDDGRAARRRLREAFEQCRQRVRTVLEVEDTTEAIETSLAEEPDLIFLDLMAPGEFSALAALKYLLDEQEDVRVVVMSALEESSPDVMAAMNVGAFAYVRKPIRKEAVQQALDSVDTAEGRMGRIR